MTVNFVTSTTIRARDQASSTFGKIAASASRMERATRQARKAADAASRAGVRGATVTGLAVAAAAKTTLSVAKDFQTARNAVFARLPDATQDQLGQLEQQAKELGGITSFSATEAAEAQEQFAAAGRSVTEILESTPKALQLAAAEAMSLGEAAGVVTNTLNQFGLEVDQTQRVVDVLQRGSSLAKSDVRQLGEALVKAGVNAANFNTPLEDTVAGILALQDAGIQPSVAGNSLAKIIGILATPTGASLEKLNELNLGISQFFTETESGDKSFRGLRVALDALEKAGATNVDFNQIFGREFATAALALRGQQAKLLASGTALRNSGGSAAQAAATRLQGLPGVFASLSSAWESFNLALLESGALDFIIEKLRELTVWLRDLTNDPDRLREWAEWFKVIATNVALAVSAMFALSKIANTVESVAKLTKFLQAATGIGAQAAGAGAGLARRVAGNSTVQNVAGGAVAGVTASGALTSAAAGAARAFPPVAAISVLAEAMRSSLNGSGLNPSQRQQAIAEAERLRAKREADKTAIRDRFANEFGQLDVRIKLEADGVSVTGTDTNYRGSGNVGTSLEIAP